MNTIRLSRIEHRGEKCIFFTIDSDPEFDRLIRLYPGRIWSNSKKSWYIPDREDSFKEIINYFRGKFRVDTTGLHEGQIHEEEVPPAVILSGQTIRRKYTTGTKYGPVSMTINYSTGRLIIKFEGFYDQEWIKELRQYGNPWYDTQAREWSLPASRIIIDSLSDYFNNRGVSLIVRKPRQPASIRKGRHSTGTEIRDRHLTPEAQKAVSLLSNHLREKRYSRHTVSNYTSQLQFFFKYFNDRLPLEITMEDISEFMEKQVIGLGYSASYQNHLITAIKTYYTLVGTPQLNLEELKRPRKGRPLPQVFSKEEVTKILNATRNLKHRLILWMIYSCGLRRSEVINIRISDLNRERGILHIRSGKGSVDRVVPVSVKVWEKLDEYLAAYNPVIYLFEGQRGGRYSAGSVHLVFKQALLRVGINKEVGVHSLRHSYATHLHETGLDIRYIQELLGHRSSRTTEIYTHVSRRNLVAVKSPIDDLNLT